MVACAVETFLDPEPRSVRLWQPRTKEPRYHCHQLRNTYHPETMLSHKPAVSEQQLWQAGQSVRTLQVYSAESWRQAIRWNSNEDLRHHRQSANLHMAR